MSTNSLKTFIRNVPVAGPVLRKSVHIARRAIHSRRRKRFQFCRQPLGIDGARPVTQIINLINYAKSRNTIYAGQTFPAGYHTITIDSTVLPGQREPQKRLSQVPLDFTGLTVLDLGCNQGGMLFSLAGRVRCGIGIDHDSRLVNVANRIATHSKHRQLAFYTLDLDNDDLTVLLDLIPTTQIDIVLLLSVCTWIKKWRDVIDFVSVHSSMLLYEANGPKEGQDEQISYLHTRFKTVELLASQSLDDSTHHARQLYLCKDSYRDVVKRVLISGVAGAGKSTLARRLGSKLNIQVIEMDALCWLSGWKREEHQVFRQHLVASMQAKSWIVDGNDFDNLVKPRADLLIWLDVTWWTAVRRVIMRTLRRIVLRERLWNGNREVLSNLFSRHNPIFQVLTKYRAESEKLEENWQGFVGRKLRLPSSRGAFRESLTVIDNHFIS
jgi:adenylate kinase family enzyme/2-polyprenyl-3-methyl-5-hydroxy-6-metoxy-1,4-benzoquinol methylase